MLSIVWEVAAGPGVLRLQTAAPPIEVPAPKQRLFPGGDDVRVGGATVSIADTLRAALSATVDTVEAHLRREGRPGRSPTPVRARLVRDDCSLGAACRTLRRPESYVIDVAPDTVRVVGADRDGLVHGLTQLAAQVRQGGGVLAPGRLLDHPDHATRGLHFVLRGVTVPEARRLVVMARRAQMNTLVVQVADGLRLPSMTNLARPDAWRPEEWTAFVAYARQNGLAVVPELKTLTHQEKLFARSRPDLLYNRETYDPRNPKVYTRVFAMIDDLIRTIEPPAIHIGHDELAGATIHPHIPKAEQLPAGQDPLPPALFLRDVQTLHTYLKSRGVETWMWGDMLVGPHEFPEMASPALHAPPDYAALRDAVPDDVVICDWHYFGAQAEFPTTQAFIHAGHDVLGATWKNKRTTERFSRYVHARRRGARGMLATTWFHVQRDEWRTVAGIVQASGRAYWTVR
jgi:hypothetical protein